MKKNIYTKALLVLAVLLIPMCLNGVVLADTTDPADWYQTVNGVLSTDYYFLYPYARKDLKIGFSKFGEMISSPIGATADQEQGLKYDGRDPFTGWPDQNKWQNGWLIRIGYTHQDYGARVIWAFALFSDKVVAGGPWGDLKYNDDPRGAPYGGRKTNGEAETNAITPLYDTPRSAAYMLRTHIFDDLDGPDTVPPGLTRIALVDLIFTIEFNKVKKEVIVKKDVLITAPYKDLGGDKKLYIDFSNRGEWDLGPSPSYASYAYFFTEGIWNDKAIFPTMFRAAPTEHNNVNDDLADDGRYTVYTPDEYHWVNAFPDGTYDVAQVIASDSLYVGWAAFWPCIQYWSVYGWEYWFQALSEKATESPWCKKKDGTDSTFTTYDTYDVADWSRRNNIFGKWAPKVSGDNPTIVVPGVDETEPKIPYIIGEWSFNLAHAVTQADRTQFRGVTVYGVTDWNDGDDANLVANNVLDSEAAFQLDEVFNPFDLYDAVHKQESRWVFKSTAATGPTQQLTAGLNDKIYYVTQYEPAPGTTANTELAALGFATPGWTGYFVRSEHDGGNYDLRKSIWVNKFQAGTDYVHTKNWALKLDVTAASFTELLKVTPIAGTPTTAAPLTLQLKDLVDFRVWYKQTVPGPGGRTPAFKLQLWQNPDGSGTWESLTCQATNAAPDLLWHEFTRPLGATMWNTHGGPNDKDWAWAVANLGDMWVQAVTVTIPQTGGLIYLDDLTIAYTMGDSGVKYRRVYNMEEDKLVPSAWNAYCSFAERVEVDQTPTTSGLLKRLGIGSTAPAPAAFSGVTKGYTIVFWEASTVVPHEIKSKIYLWKLVSGVVSAWTLTTPNPNQTLKVLYSTIEENEKGRYEWGVTGKDAGIIDTTGLGFVTEAFDSIKGIHVHVTGMDIQETQHAPTAPYVFYGSGGTKTAYRDTYGRSRLNDDFCGTYAIESSNLVHVGGPLANLGSEYMNDFMPLMYGMNDGSIFRTIGSTVTSSYAGKIVAWNCWTWDKDTVTGLATKKTWSNVGSTTGYAVIYVYKDINGAVHLSIWGLTGSETYWATYWLYHGDGTTPGIVQLQSMNRGVVGMVLKITYPTGTVCVPTFTANYHLQGTISCKYPVQTDLTAV